MFFKSNFPNFLNFIFSFFVSESIWHTDLDFMMVHKDRLVVLSFMTAPNNSALTQPLPSALPIITTSDEGDTSPLDSSTQNINQPHALPFTNSIVKGLRNLIGHDNHLSAHNYNVGE